MTFTLFFTPGHTPGGTTYIIEDHVFVGDTLFKGSIGRTDLPGGNWEILNKSLLKMMETISPDFTLHSGHGPDTTMKMERIENPFLIPIEKQLNSTI
jgi:glyoxylase-like metal-dependent hydrolase (beta-lactamase superfamily II)